MNTLGLIKLNDRIAVVTGGYGKVGRCVVEALAELGCKVIIASRRSHEVGFGSCKKHIGFHKCDVTIKKDVIKLRESVLQKHGKIDILVNCVTGNSLSLFEEMSLRFWEKALKDGLNSIFLCTQIIGSAMKERKYGCIVNMGSIYGVVAADQRIYGDSGLNSSVVYATIKSAILNFTRYVAVYWAGDGIRCNTLSLGGLEDPSNEHEYFRRKYIDKTPLGRMLRKDDIKGAIAFLVGDGSQYYTGQNLILDGGLTAW